MTHPLAFSLRICLRFVQGVGVLPSFPIFHPVPDRTATASNPPPGRSNLFELVRRSAISFSRQARISSNELRLPFELHPKSFRSSKTGFDILRLDSIPSNFPTRHPKSIPALDPELGTTWDFLGCPRHHLGQSRDNLGCHTSRGGFCAVSPDTRCDSALTPGVTSPGNTTVTTRTICGHSSDTSSDTRLTKAMTQCGHRL